MKRLLTIVTISFYGLIISCNNQPVTTQRQYNDTTAIVQAILNSNIFGEIFYSKGTSESLCLYTRTKRRWEGRDSVYGTFCTRDSIYTFKGQQVKIIDTPFDGTKYDIGDVCPPYPYRLKEEYTMGLIGIRKLEKEEAWFDFCFQKSNIDGTAHLKKINNKWIVIDYKYGQY